MCIFCHIIAKKKPAEVVYENDTIIAFKDINPKAPVHILIVPKKHIASINEIEKNDGDILSEILFSSKEIARDQKIDDAYKLIFNVGKKGGQIIDHLHLHLLGGF